VVLLLKLVRLSLTEEEYKAVYGKAMEKGCSSIPEYLRFLLLKKKPEMSIDFDQYLQLFKKAVLAKNDYAEFRVKDCFDSKIWNEIDVSDRRTLGRMIIHKVESGDWLPIKATKKDSGNAQWYRKRRE